MYKPLDKQSYCVSSAANGKRSFVKASFRLGPCSWFESASDELHSSFLVPGKYCRTSKM